MCSTDHRDHAGITSAESGPPRNFAETEPPLSREEAIQQARLLPEDLEESSDACPFGIDLRTVATAVERGDFRAALETIRSTNPWPGIMGRACKGYCDREMDPGSNPHGVSLKALERAVATHADLPADRFDRPPQATGRVAVVGAGSAGAAVSYGLRRIGHDVHVFEALPQPGGMMTVGFPEFRLPSEVVSREVDFEAWGVSTHYATPVNRDKLEELMQSHDAVVITTGQCEPIELQIPGSHLQGVHSALGFLRDHRLGRKPTVGHRAVVIGGGYTAQDVARTLRRLGATVTILYRRGPDDLRVRPTRRDHFLRVLANESIAIEFWTDVLEISGHEGRVTAAKVARKDASAQTDDGSPGVVDYVECDMVVGAIGEYADNSFLPADVATEGGLIMIDDDFSTSRPGLFAVGETADGPHGTDMAFAQGLRAAETISHFLKRLR